MKAPHQWLFAHAACDPSAPAIDTPRHRVSYGALASRVRRFAATLAAAGLRPGERVLVSLANSPACVVVSLAVQAAGGCACEIRSPSAAAGRAECARQVGARFGVVSAGDEGAWRSYGFERLWRVADAAGAGELNEAGESVEVSSDGGFEPPLINVDAPALVLFTSGSTGTPLGVVLSFRNLDANARAIASYLQLTASDRALLPLPLAHAYGRSVLHSHLLVGGSIFLEGRLSFPRLVLDALSSEGCTGFPGVPAVFELLRQRGVIVSPPKSLRYVTQAGGPMSLQTVKWVRERFHPAQLFVMYGQTEATARLAYLPPAFAEGKAGAIGVPVPGMQLRVVGENGVERACGEVGELVARGPGVALGYLEAPDERARTFRNGWLHTGDLAFHDADGFFFVVDRAKEVLKVSGHRVSPARIEAVLVSQPGVAEASVVGLPDALEGEVPVAAVVALSGGVVSVDSLRRSCREQLGSVCVPRIVRVVSRLPRGEAGKVLRREVAKMLAVEPSHKEIV